MKYLLLLCSIFLWSCSPDNNSQNPVVNTSESAVTSTLVEFGSFKTTDSQKLASAIIYNNTGSNLTGPATLSSSDFAFVSGFNCAAGAKNKASCPSIKLTFSPAGKSPGEYNATLNLGSISVPLHATILSPPPPVISFTSSLGSAIDFGSFLSTTNSTITKTLAITNTGTAAMIGVVSLTGTNYTKTFDTCNGASIAKNSSCQIKIAFNPYNKAAGNLNETLTVNGMNISLAAIVSTPDSIAQSGEPVVIGGVTYEANVNFYNGASIFTTYNYPTGVVLLTTTLKNTGNVAAVVTSPVLSNPTNFSFALNNCNNISLGVNASCQMKINFASTTVGTYTTNLTFGSKVLTLSATKGCSAGFHVEGNICVADSFTYEPVYSNYGACSAAACDGTGISSRTLTACNKLSSGVVVGTADLSNCSVYNTAGYLQQPCQSAAGNKTISISNGQQIIYCAAGSTVAQNIISTTCNLDFSNQNNTCVADSVTFTPNYSDYGSCSAANACDGSGNKVRTIQSCQKNINGLPVAGGQISDCATYNTISNLQESCLSPAGEKSTNITNGQQIIYCAAGSTVAQNVVSTTCDLNFTNQNNSCIADTITYEASYSDYGACSATNPCDGVGLKNRTISACQKIRNGVPEAGGQISDCSAFNISSNLQSNCDSPAGQTTIGIENGSNIVNCSAGSTTQTIVSTTCDLNFEVSGQSCIASCLADQHRELDLCVSNTIACSENNGTGTKTWNGTDYGSCQISSCAQHYVVDNNICVGELLNFSLSKTEGGVIVGNLISLYNSTADSASVNFNYSPTNVEMLQAQADPGYHFVGWSGDCSGTNEFCSLSLSAAKNVSATFERNLQTFYYGAFFGEGGSVTGSYSVNSGVSWTPFVSGYTQVPENSLIKLEATPQPGKDFYKWLQISECQNNFTNICQFNLPANLIVGYAEFGDICDTLLSHKEEGSCVYNYRQCSPQDLSNVSQYAQSGTQHYENGVWGSYCTLSSCVSGYNVNEFLNTCESSNVAYSPVYSAPSECSASVACQGAGVKSRTLTGCKRYVSNVFQSNVDIGNCAIYSSPEFSDIACASPAGNTNVTIDNGYKTVSCLAGSTNQTFISTTCNTLYSAFGETCVAQKLLTVSQPAIVSNQIRVTTGSHVNEALSSLYIDDSSVVQLTVSLGNNFIFSAWTGDCAGQGSTCSLTMDTNKNVGVVVVCNNGYDLVGQNCVSALSTAILSTNLPVEYVSLSTANPISSFTAAPATFSTTGAAASGTGASSTLAAITPSGAGVAATGTGSTNIMDASSTNAISVNIDTNSITSCSNPYLSVTCSSSAVNFSSSSLSLLNLNPFLVNLNSSTNLEIPYKYYQIEQISNLNSAGSDMSSINNAWLVQRGTNIYFRGANAAQGSKIFKYNPTLGTIAQITDTSAGGEDGISNLTLFNGEIFFFGSDPSFNYRLFKIDSQDRVIQVSKFNAASGDVISTSNSGYITVFNNDLYFSGNNSSGLQKLFKVTAAGAISQVSNIRNGSQDNPVNLTVFNGELYFVANATTGLKLFKMTTTGTISQITNFRATSDITSTPSVPPLMVYKNELYFNAINTAGFQKLFKLNTTGTITQVSNIRGSTSSDAPIVQAVFNGELYFTAQSAAGVKLYKLTDTGSIVQVSSASSPTMFMVSNNELYFYQINGTVSKLHKINTTGEIVQVSNIKPGLSDLISGVATVGTDLYFVSSTSVGNKLFRLKKLK